MLGIKPGSSTSAVNPRAVSPALCLLVFELYVNTQPCFVGQTTLLHAIVVCPSYCGAVIPQCETLRFAYVTGDRLFSGLGHWAWPSFPQSLLTVSFRAHVLALL